ncbi:MAG: zinc ribbon domain-containing protein, partial [Nitrososphaerales archaeon]
LLTTFLIIVAIGLVIAFLGQLKSALSMRQLSKEISEPRIGAAANLLILTYAVGGVSFAVLVSILPGLISSLSLASSGVPNQTALLGDLFTGSLILAGLLYAAEIVLFLIACTLGYLGLNAASSKLESLKFSTTSSIYPPPPPTNPSMTEGVRYCASCGSKVQSGASFCTNCGAKV